MSGYLGLVSIRMKTTQFNLKATKFFIFLSTLIKTAIVSENYERKSFYIARNTFIRF